MELNLDQLQELYEEEKNKSAAARAYCELNGIEYNDTRRKYISETIRTFDFVKKGIKGIRVDSSDNDLGNTTETETNQYKNDNQKEREDFFMPSAWDSEKNRFLSIDEYCDKYGLPKEQVRSSKLVSHVEKHMVYNIAFNPTLNEQTGIDEDFIDSVVNKHVKPFKPRLLSSGEPDWVDRVVITDVHIGMDTEGGSNITPLYDELWNKESLFDRLFILVDKIKRFQKGDTIIIDELGDFLDGLFGQTTRKGHELPQNMSDKEAFEVAVEFKNVLIDSLLDSYSNIVLNNITEDNHSGVFGYFVNSTVKKIVEQKYSNVEYNLLERFINHYSVGNHTFLLSHGKDSESLKFGFKPALDPKQIEKIDQYCKENKLYDGKLIEFSKGDSHQAIFDYTTSNDFEYCNYPAFSPPSNWVKTNFKNARSGFVMQHLDMNSKIKLHNPFWFDK